MLTLQLLLCALTVTVLVLVILFRPKPNNNLFALSYKLDDLFKKFDALTGSLHEDLKTARSENASLSAQSRQELNETLNSFRREMTETLRLITDQNKAGADSINKTLDEKIGALIQKVEANNKEASMAMASAILTRFRSAISR